MPLALLGVRLIVIDGETAFPKVVILDLASLGERQVDRELPAHDVVAQRAKQPRAFQFRESIGICIWDEDPTNYI